MRSNGRRDGEGWPIRNADLHLKQLLTQLEEPRIDDCPRGADVLALSHQVNCCPRTLELHPTRRQLRMSPRRLGGMPLLSSKGMRMFWTSLSSPGSFPSRRAVRTAGPLHWECVDTRPMFRAAMSALENCRYERSQSILGTASSTIEKSLRQHLCNFKCIPKRRAPGYASLLAASLAHGSNALRATYRGDTCRPRSSWQIRGGGPGIAVVYREKCFPKVVEFEDRNHYKGVCLPAY